jgi:hypothetical protein
MGRRARAAGVGGGDGGSAIGGGRELAGVAHSGATGHGLPNQRHRDDAEAMATSTMPFARSGKATNVMAAMAGGEELAGARETISRGHDWRR